MLVVGSKAFKYNFPNSDRVYRDIDLIGYRKDVTRLVELLNPTRLRDKNGLIALIKIQNKTEFYDTDNVEILLADDCESLQSYLEYTNTVDSDAIATPDILFSLKKSHIHFPLYFDKHIKDYSFLYKHFDGVDSLRETTKMAFKDVEKRIGKLKTPSLNKSLTEFFGQSKGFVKSYFIHDDIHKAVAHYDEPLYLRMQRDKTLARCERDMWDKFSYEDKCKCVLEEAYVIALERLILPAIFGGGKWKDPEEALNWALGRICTTLCSGWFREFATNNYFEIKGFINKSYAEDFLLKYNNNEINRSDVVQEG